jgi:hypothetical protein
MSQDTRHLVRDQINLLRDSEQLPFCDLLDEGTIQKVLDQEDVSFRETVFTPIVTLWTFLSQVISADRSCRKAIDQLLAYLVARGKDPCRPEKTDTYCKARQRLPVGVTQSLTRKTAEDLEDKAPEEWLWKGRHVNVVDGTTVSMPDTESNQRAFPQPKTQARGVGFPLARLVAVISLATAAVRDLAIGPYKGKETGETALFRTLMDRLQRGDVVLGDRYFASYFGIAMLVQRGVDGLFRLHQKRKVDFRRGRRLGVEDHVVEWTRPARPDWMDEELYALIPETMLVRELRVQVEEKGFRVSELVLATTMVDGQVYSKEELADLFLERWNIELDLRSIKIAMEMDVLRCKTAQMVVKEIWTHLLAYNLIRGLIAAAAEAHGKEPRRLSFKGALQALQAFRDSMGLTSRERRRALVEQMLLAIIAYEVGNRPGRVEPRAIKRRPKPHDLLCEPREQARERLLGNRVEAR